MTSWSKTPCKSDGGCYHTFLNYERELSKLLSSTHAGKKQNRYCLITIAENIRFLTRQGIAHSVEMTMKVPVISCSSLNLHYSPGWSTKLTSIPVCTFTDSSNQEQVVISFMGVNTSKTRRTLSGCIS